MKKLLSCINKLRSQLVWAAVVVGLLAALAPTTWAQSATETPTPTATATTEAPPAGNLSITAVQPGTLVNDVQVELIVTGSGFVNGSVVVLNNFGGLETFFVSASVLFAPTSSPACPPVVMASAS